MLALLVSHAAYVSPSTVFTQQVLYGVNQRLRVEDVDSPLCEVRPVKAVLLVVLTGDRGLCGGYNNFIIKKVRCSRRSVDCCGSAASTHVCL